MTHEELISTYKEFINVYEQYVKLLSKSESMLIGMAYVHGFIMPQDMVKEGERLRRKIYRLKDKINGL